jgi:hypothetical protein
VKPVMKHADWIQVCKSIANGHDQGLDSAQILKTMHKLALTQYKDEPLSPEQKFAKLMATPDGQVMYQASKRAPPGVMDNWDFGDQEEDKEDTDNGNAEYNEVMRQAEKTRRPQQTTASRFAELWMSPEMTKTRTLQKRNHLARVSKAMYG